MSDINETTKDQDVAEIESQEKLEEAVKAPRRSFLDVERIPGGEFLRSQLKKVIGTLILLVFMIIIIDLSQIINNNSDSFAQSSGEDIDQEIDPESNPVGVISIHDNTHKILMLLSSIVFFTILAFFTKIVFYDEREAFGVTKILSVRAVLFFLLTIAFISLIYLLFDIALTRIYLLTLPIYIIWDIHNHQFSIPFLSDVIIGKTSRKAYSDVRGFIFSLLLAFMIAFPLALTILLITRYSRRSLNKKERTWQPYKIKNWLIFIAAIPALLLSLALFSIISRIELEVPLEVLLLPVMVFILGWWVLQVIILTTRALRLKSSAIFANLFIFFLISFLFYVLPAFLWAIWDILTIFNLNTIENTVYHDNLDRSLVIDPENIGQITLFQFFELFIQTFVLNLFDFLRILELDFVIIVGLSSLAIGFAEGYSLIAIVRSLYAGVSIAKSGRIAQRSAPRAYILFSRSVLLTAWVSLFWDKFLLLWNGLIVSFNLPLPIIDLPSVFELVFDLTIELSLLGGIFLAISILLLPTYFVVTSSFKFLSVSLVAERIKEDNQTFFFLISSAFILIVTNILGEITELPDFQSGGDSEAFLPLRGVATEQLLPFARNIFGTLEAIGFLFGFLFTLSVGLRYVVRRIFRKTK